MPYDPPRGAPYDKVPDYLSVFISPGKIGYTPKAYLTAPNGATNTPLLGRVAPVYAEQSDDAAWAPNTLASDLYP